MSILPEAKIAVARQNSTALFEAAVPLKSFHLDPADLKETLGDVGRVLSDQTGTRASNRVYWSNKSTTMKHAKQGVAMTETKQKTEPQPTTRFRKIATGGSHEIDIH